MRGLSADERGMLAIMASDAEFDWSAGDPDEARWDAVHESLVARGCAVHSVEVDDGDDGFEWDIYEITDLGHLAPRVSQVAEALS